MATQAQTEANRANAEKSTGPRTEAGKARTRRNATRHNLCSGVALQSDEDREQFDILHADLRLEHKPDGPTEDIFVHKMAQHFWFSWHAAILLAKDLDTNDECFGPNDEGEQEDNVKRVSLMLRYHTTADRGFIKNFNELRKLQKERRLEEIGSVPQNAETHPEAPPEAAPEPPHEPSPMTPVTVIRPDQTQVVVAYVQPNEADIKKSVENYLARKSDKVA